MKSCKIIAIVDYVPFIVVSDGTAEGTYVDEGPESYVKAFNKALADSFVVRLGDGHSAPRATAGYTPLGLTAAIFSINPAHTQILRVPREVREVFPSTWPSPEFLETPDLQQERDS